MDRFRSLPWLLLGIGILWSVPVPGKPVPLKPRNPNPPVPVTVDPAPSIPSPVNPTPVIPSPADTVPVSVSPVESAQAESERPRARFRLFRRLRGC